MNLQKNTFSPKYLYHYTTYERAQQILKEKSSQQGSHTGWDMYSSWCYVDLLRICQPPRLAGLFQQLRYQLLEYPKEGQECQHTTEQVVITEATPQTDALGAEECTQCGKVFKYYDIQGNCLCILYAEYRRCYPKSHNK